MSAPPVTHFGRYRVLEELGRGAMGVVYLAEDASLHRQVAVKAMLLEADTEERVELERRFRQEAQAAGGLNHPNVITIHELGREGDWLYIAMELVRGTELRDLIRAGQLPLADALDVAAQVAEGLAAAHAKGVVHRDVKPSNIMVLPGGQAKIMDFGIARVQSAEVRTRTGVALGSPKYMSPEQLGGRPVDHRSDIFSLGAMLYEMATGLPAFDGIDLGALLHAIVHATPAPPSSVRAGVPPALDAIVARALQKDPALRYQAADEMARALADCRARLGDAPPARPDVDPFGATQPDVAGAATVPLTPAPPGLPVSALVDSGTAVQALLDDARTGAHRPVRTRRPSLGWTLAYAVAVLCAIAIVFA